MRAITAVLAVAMLLSVPAVVDAGGLKARKLKGDLTATDEDADLKARFSLLTLSSGTKGFCANIVAVRIHQQILVSPGYPHRQGVAGFAE